MGDYLWGIIRLFLIKHNRGIILYPGIIIMFYHIIATNPYHFSWNTQGKCCHESMDKFKIEAGRIISENGQRLCINPDWSVSFSDESNEFTLMEIRKNVYKIKDTQSGRYIRHYASALRLDLPDKSEIFESDSNWILFGITPANYIIARYNEDISWTRYLQGSITIYNKGLPNIISPHAIVQLPNIGREGHTYLHHITESYNTLQEGTSYIFLQGDPFPHSPFILELLCNGSDRNFKGLSLWYSKTWPTPEITNRFKNSDNTTTYILSDAMEYVGFKTKYFLVGGNVRTNPQVIADFMNRYKITKKNAGFIVSLAGLFVVKKSAIISNSLEFYTRLLEASTLCKLNGYILEMLWPTIFDGHN